MSVVKAFIPKPAALRLAVLFWLVTRIVILFLPMHLSDVRLFHLAAFKGLVMGKIPYQGFWFPYPPLGLAMTYIPYTFGMNEIVYRWRFQLEMFLFDGLTLAYLFRITSLLGFSRARQTLCVILYAVLGIGVAHLLYDRLDLAIAFVWVALVAETVTRKPSIFFLALLAFLGISLKIAPLFFLPAVWLSMERKKIGPVIAATLLPSLIVLTACNAFTDGALFRVLGEHGTRGIQVESLWTTPYWLADLFVANYTVRSEFYNLASHLAADSVPAPYLFISKYAGFAGLAVFSIWVWIKRAAFTPQQKFLLFLLMLAFLILSQRVLSPQFFIWLLPGAALFLAGNFSWWRGVVVGGIYLFTFLEFYFYLDLVDGKSLPAIFLLVRNGLLGWFCVDAVRVFGKKLSFVR